MKPHRYRTKYHTGGHYLISLSLSLLMIVSACHAEDQGNLSLKRSGFKEVTNQDEPQPDSTLVSIDENYFGKISNGNYTNGKLSESKQVKTSNTSSSSASDNKSNDSSSGNLGSNITLPKTQQVKDIDNLKEIKASGSLGNPIKTHIKGYNANTAIFYSVGSSRTIFIDPGHQKHPTADMTSGTSSIKTKKSEYELTLEFSEEICKQLLSAGYNVVMSRTVNDANISNKQRGQLCASVKPDIGIAVHMDSVNGGANGFTNVCPSGLLNEHDEIAKRFYTAFSKNMKTGGLGIKCRRTLAESLVIFKNCRTSPIFLTEAGFISEGPPNDCDLVESKAYQQAFAKMIVKTCQSQFPLKK